MATGRAYDASACHEIGSATKPAPLREKTVPEKRSTMGTTPSSRAWKYLAAATSKSYVHTMGRSASVAPPKPGTTALAWVHRNGRSESPHCGVSPNSSYSRATSASP